MKLLSTILSAAFLLSSPAASFSLPEAILPVPHEDPFYDAPNNLDSLKPGQIYASRQVIPEIEYIGAKEVYQIAYRTTDTFGNASHTVATVFTPWNPDSSAKLFSYQTWEDSDNIDCSPSYSIYGGVATPDGITTSLDTPIFVEWALAKGYYVVAPDHEGPKSTFFAGFNEGYGTIDGIRAAISHFALPGSTAVGLYGYSGGAHATVWATNLVGDYAPELNIIGSAAGGTPVDPIGTIKYLDGHTFAGFVLGAFAGLLKAYPDVSAQVWPNLTSELRSDIGVVNSDNTCILTEVLAYGNKEYHTMTSFSDFFAEPIVVRLLAHESLLKNISSVNVSTPKFPRYYYHAVGDEIIPNDLLSQYVSQQCDSGANIQYVKWPGGDHLTTEYLGIPDSLQFIQQAFAGKTPSVPCGTASQDILTLTTDGVGSIIGQSIVDAINALAGVITPLGTIKL